MRGLFGAIQFMTRLPVGKSVEFRPEEMIPLFPVVGLIIGGLLLVFDAMVTNLWPGPVAALLDVIFLIAVTGAFHLDGLGDSADGLYGHRTKEQALAIMKDSRVGVMGLVAIVSCLAVKWAGISGVDAHRVLSLLIIPAYARGCTLFGFRFLKYGRPDGGTGHPFFNTRLQATGFGWLFLPMFLSLFLGWKCILLNGGFILVTWMLLAFYKKKIGCITGDMLGAMVEIMEAVLFLLVSIH